MFGEAVFRSDDQLQRNTDAAIVNCFRERSQYVYH